jgi:hypothetical protein
MRPSIVGSLFLLTLIIGFIPYQCIADEHPSPVPSILPTIVVPEPPPINPPNPPLSPTIPQFPHDRVYVAKSATPFILTSSPRESTTIIYHRGPIAIYAKFADTPTVNTPVLRNFTDEYVCIVTPSSATGLVELIAIPSTANLTEDQLQRITLQLGPIPPPTPPVPPTPVPVPVTEFRVIFVYDTAVGYAAPIQRILDSQKIRDYLTSKVTKTDTTPDWRFWDVDSPLSSNTSPSLSSMFMENKPNFESKGVRTKPLMLIRKNGTTTLIPVPDDETSCLALLKTYGG